MAVYRLTIEYDGTGWHGWQTQPGVPTIQEALEGALATALREPVQVTGSGRTDAGVHAEGQVAHFATAREFDTHGLLGNLNGLLPRSIAVAGLEGAAETFHARYDAVLRTYGYRISTRPLALERNRRVFVRPEPDFEAMNAAAGLLTGVHDFSAFCRTASETENRVCRVQTAAWQEGEPEQWEFVIAADRFLHGMVRAIVGTLLQVGRDYRTPESVRDILESKDRREAGPAAPARGLVLRTVSYPEKVMASRPAEATGGEADPSAHGTVRS